MVISESHQPIGGVLGVTAVKADVIHAEPTYLANDGLLIEALVLTYWVVAVSLFLSLLFASVWCLTDQKQEENVEEAEDDESAEPSMPPFRDLPQNMWSLNLLSSIGQAGMKHQWGKTIVSYDMRPSLVAAISLGMAGAQCLALYCVIHDLDPNATPVTSKPAAPWVKDVWTVNFMKWFMVSILSINAVGEAGQCRVVVTATIETNRERLSVPRVFTLGIVMVQYAVLLFMLFVGIAAQLSFNDVPNIIYSGMAITFITQTDELIFELMHQVMDLEINFMVVHGVLDDPAVFGMGDETTGSNTKDSGPLSKAQGSGTGSKSQPKGSGSHCRSHPDCLPDEHLCPTPIPMWVDIFCHFLVTLPMLWGLLLISRAFLTNVMPNARVNAAIRQAEDSFGHFF